MQPDKMFCINFMQGKWAKEAKVYAFSLSLVFWWGGGPEDELNASCKHYVTEPLP